MRLIKMSLLAATLVASSAFAIENTKAAGDAKLFYWTQDSGENSLFNKNGTTGQVAANVGITTDLTEGVSAGASIIALSTLGLEGQLVSDVWEHTNGTSDTFWFDEVWLAGTVGKTTGKIGRMKLDTPLVFSETWSIASNTFEAAVLINQDIPDTTLVGAYVGGSNGGTLNRLLPGNIGAVIAITNPVTNTNFSQFYKGAYAAGVINNSWKPLSVQAWYYGATSTATAYWAEADLEMDFGLLFGAQYTGMTLKKGALGVIPKKSSNSAFAVKAGYQLKDIATLSAAYSKTGKDDDNGVGAGMNMAASGQSKLYTEAWWNYGYITRNDTSAINVTATTPESLTWAQLGIYFTQSASKDAFSGAKGKEDLKMTEVTVEAAKSFGPLDIGLYYIMTKADDQNQEKLVKKGDAFNAVQAYFTYNF